MNKIFQKTNIFRKNKCLIKKKKDQVLYYILYVLFIRIRICIRICMYNI